MKSRLLLAVVAILLLSGALAPVNGSVIAAYLPGDPVIEGSTINGSNGGQWFSRSWTQDAAANVSISIYLSSYSPVSVGYILSTAIGPGATAADVISSGATFVDDGTYSLRQLLSGLNLSANTYYLTAYVNTPGTAAWGYAWGPVVSRGNLGTTYTSIYSWPSDLRNFASPLNSTWVDIGSSELTLLVESNAAPVPEPATILLLTPLAIAAFFLRRRFVR